MPEPEPAQQSTAAPGMDESLRETALRAGDRKAFLAPVDPDELGFSATQAGWFDKARSA